MRLLNLLLLVFSSSIAAAQPFGPPPDAESTASGLVTQRLVAGTGEARPDERSTLRLRYVLRTPDGNVVSKVEAPQEVLLPMWKMIPGWREAALMMVTGESRRAWVTAALGAKVPSGFDSVVIDTELLEIIPAPTTPSDVAAPPPDATHKKSGLAYKLLRKGDGSRRPNMQSEVTVHYSGWTTDGNLFDTSLTRGEPSTLPMRGVIRGWQDMLAEMVEGDRVRVWIPERLAYRGERGKPKGMLVFEIDLIGVQ